MSASIRRNLRSYEDKVARAGATEKEALAASYRINFLRKHIINFDTNLYQTTVERDWAYIAKREYNFDVKYKSWGYGFFVGNLAWTARMYMLKKFVFWPLPVVGTLACWYFKPVFLMKHNKKLFDMCNIGEQYYLGKERNKTLRKCNEILDTEDFQNSLHYKKEKQKLI